jgi:hypothetical protein
LENE